MLYLPKSIEKKNSLFAMLALITLRMSYGINFEAKDHTINKLSRMLNKHTVIDDEFNYRAGKTVKTGATV